MQKEVYYVQNNKVSSNKTLAVISDIHLKDSIDFDYFYSMMGTLDDISPDYIVLVGDYFHGLLGKYTFWDPKSRNHFLYYLHAFRELAPVIMSLGNHDIERFRDKEKRKHFKSLEQDDIYPLDNEHLILDDFNFMGYIPPKWAYSVDRIVKRKEKMIINDVKNINFEVKEDKMNILLSHLPNIFQNECIMNRCPELFQYDLVLSGHLHGGLTKEKEIKLHKAIDRLQKIKLLHNYKEYLESFRDAGYMWITLNAIPFISKKTRGIHEINGTTMIIGRGAKMTHGIEDAYITEVGIERVR